MPTVRRTGRPHRASIELIEAPIRENLFLHHSGAQKCLAKLQSGEVAMAIAHALSDEERASGYILTCQAKPKSDVTIYG